MTPHPSTPLGTCLHLLLPPEGEELEAVLHRLLRQVRALLAEVEETWPEEDLDVLRAEGAQHRLAFDEEGPKKKARGWRWRSGANCSRD